MSDISVNDVVDNLLLEIDNTSIFTEDVKPQSKMILEKVYPHISQVLSTPAGSQKFKHMVGAFMDKNHSKLHTPGPQYMVGFTDKDKSEYFDLFGIT